MGQARAGSEGGSRRASRHELGGPAGPQLSQGRLGIGTHQKVISIDGQEAQPTKTVFNKTYWFGSDTLGRDIFVRVLNGARIGTGSLVAAGAVVLEGTVVPPHSLVAGVPAKVRRELTGAEREKVRANALTYVQLSEEHRQLDG